jgi:hypothetical protein
MSDERGGFRSSYKTSAIMERYSDPADFTISSAVAPIGQKVVHWWSHHGRWNNKADAAVQNRPVWVYATEQWMQHWPGDVVQDRQDRDVLQREYGLVGHQWSKSEQNALVVAVPIATLALFYGYIIIVLPAESATAGPSPIQDLVWEKVGDLADRFYLPVLTVLVESMIEEDLVSLIRERKGAGWKLAAREFASAEKVPFLHSIPEHSDDPEQDKCPDAERAYDPRIERPLHQLWMRRRQLLDGRGDSAEDRWTFLDTLLFAEYFVASPGLIKQLKQVLAVDLKMPAERSSLSAALVYGGPGSGKDVMVRLVPLCSRHYFFTDLHTLNMAAVRPALVTGPLLEGLRLTDFNAREQGHGQTFNIEGLLVEAKRRMAQKPVEYHPPDQRDGHGAVFILDELNSLDVDLQGILLRILEQGEITPLFDLEKQYVQHLIVGVVNEDPEEISRESELGDLLHEKGRLGTLFSGFLYETLRRTRRLRQDLYHRLKRQLYVRLPDIRERVEDIPVLFYKFCTKEPLPDRKLEVIVNLDAYRLLMDRRITWPGNVRQIQAVAKKSIDNATEELQGASGRLIVNRTHVLKALQDEFPGFARDADDDEDQRRDQSWGRRRA